MEAAKKTDFAKVITNEQMEAIAGVDKMLLLHLQER